MLSSKIICKILIPTSLHVLLAKASLHSGRSTRWNKRCTPTWSGSSTSIPPCCAIFNVVFSKISLCPTHLKPSKTTMGCCQHKPLFPTILTSPSTRRKVECVSPTIFFLCSDQSWPLLPPLPTASMLSSEGMWHKTDWDKLELVSRSPA